MNPEKQISLIKKNVVQIVKEEELLEKIKQKSSLKIKLGVDPTAPDIHLGTSIPLLKLRCFQDLGHKVILVIGDFTGRIGDPSGRVKTRKPLTSEEINFNARTYQEQVFKILNPEKTKIVFNSKWLAPLNFSQILDLASHYTVARILERDDFYKRYHHNYPIGLHEFLYPLMQAYDSVALKSDVEIGGTDQTFNLLVGREIQKSYGQSPQVVITLPLLEGTDGKEKMSKSLGNYIGINEPPPEIYGKIMSLPDELTGKYFHLLTSLSEEEIKNKEKLHPKKAKEDLAMEIVSFYYGKSSAEKASAKFNLIFKEKKIPEDVPIQKIKEDKIWIIKLLQSTGLARSSSEARRLILQGGVKWDGEKIKDINLKVSLDNEHILQAGKKKFMKIVKKS